ncbi:MAG: hypothetical protein H6631_20785 [Anaerolineaceae bacterium]|nr:hypothetical protein [Anaerolineaceae bacterium]MCB9099249.1 hypothetical protein [Anaerolineales bacterium]
MADTLYQECPFCMEAPISLQGGSYICEKCGLTLKDRAVLGLFNKGRYQIIHLAEGNFSLVTPELDNIVLKPDPLKVVIGNIYSDEQLAEIASGNIDIISPVKTVLAQIILEQLNEVCYINVNGLRRGHGQPLSDESGYWPTQKAPRENMKWQDEGNLFCTNQRLVLPSNQFTFIRLDRKVVNVQAYTDGFALQRKNEEYATYFIGCYPHEAALVAAYAMAKVPALRSRLHTTESL